jgi:hypothetical protein
MSDDDKSHDILTMWMELQRAVSKFATNKGVLYQSVEPWES